MSKHNVENLDKGQLEFMWNFMRFKCGQKSNIPLLKHNLDILRQAMIQKTGGQKLYKKADDVSYEDLGQTMYCSFCPDCGQALDWSDENV